MFFFVFLFFAVWVTLPVKAETDRMWIDSARLSQMRLAIQVEGSVHQKSFQIMQARVDSANRDSIDWTIYGGSWDGDNWNYYRNRLVREASMLYLLTDSTVYAQLAYDVLFAIHNDPDPDGRLPESGYGLARATVGLGFAIAYNWCYPAWNSEQRAYVRSKIILSLDNWPSYSHVNLDTYDNGSNWVGVCRSAELLMMLATAEDTIRTERYGYLHASLFSHINTAFGDKGFCQEGNGYIAYPGAFLFPAVFALAHKGDSSLFYELNQKRFWEIVTYTSAFSFFKEDGPLPYFTKANNFGVGSNTFNQEGFKNLLFNTVDGDELRYYQYIYDHQEGLQSGRPDAYLFDQTRAGMLWLLTYYPFDQESSLSPQGNMPLSMVDSVYGYAVFRNQWKDSNDIVFSLAGDQKNYGRAWDQPEASQITLTANNMIFFSGPGKNTSRADYSTLQTDHISDSKRGGTSGRLISMQRHSHGGYAVVDGFNKYHEAGLSKMQRHALVQYQENRNSGLFAIMDQMSAESPHTYTFNLSLGHWKQEDTLPVVIGQEQGVTTFLIQGEDHAYLKGWVINPPDATVESDGLSLSVTTSAAMSDTIWVVMLTDTGFADTLLLDYTGMASHVQIKDTLLAYNPVKNSLFLGTPHLQSPGYPENLTVNKLSDNSVSLGWEAPLDSDLAGYRLYRLPNADAPLDEASLINARVTTNSFFDEGLGADSSYWYKIVAYDVWGNEADSVPGIQAKTLVDVFSPQVVSVHALSASSLELLLDQRLSGGDVLPENFSIDNGVAVQEVQQVDDRTIRLITSPLSDGIAYTLAVRELSDENGNKTLQTARFAYYPEKHITESFEYCYQGDLAYQGSGSGWKGAWLYNMSQVREVFDTVLTVGGISGGSKAVELAEKDQGILRYFKDRYLISNDDVFVSFLLRIPDQIDQEGVKIGLYNPSGRFDEYFIGIDQSSYGDNLLVKKFNNEETGHYDFTPGETVLFVAAVQGSVMKLWINPETEEDEPQVELMENTKQLGGLGLYTENAGKVLLDDIHIGYDFRSVVQARRYAKTESPAFLSLTPTRINHIELSWLNRADSLAIHHVFRKKSTDSDYQWLDSVAVGLTHYVDTSSKELIEYQYVVRALVDSVNKSVYSNQVAVDIAQYVPHKPVNLALEQLSDTVVQLNWQDLSDNESGFIVYTKTGSGSFYVLDTVEINATSYANSYFVNQKFTHYKIRSYNDFADSDLTDSVTAIKLNIPGDMLLSSVPGEIHLDWEDLSAYETGYQVQRKLNAGAFEDISNTPPDAESSIDDIITENAWYTYRVRAIRDGFFSAYSAVDSIFIPIAPEDFAITYMYEGHALISWKPFSTNAHGVVLSMESNTEAVSLLDTIWVESSSYYHVSGLETEKPYTFYGMSFYDQGVSSLVTEDLFIPETPSSLSVATVSNGIYLDWEDQSAGETHTVIERRMDQGDWLAYDSVPADSVSFLDTAVVEGHTYTYRVYAVTENAWSSRTFSVSGVYSRDLSPVLTADFISDNTVKLDWTIRSDFHDAFWVERKTADGNYERLSTEAAWTTRWTGEPKEPMQTNTYRIGAFYSLTGSVLYASPVSLSLGSYLPAVPYGLNATLRDDSLVINLSWMDSTDVVDGFVVERKMPQQSFELLDSTIHSYWVDTHAIEAGNTYIYRVKAYNRFGFSAYSLYDTLHYDETSIPALLLAGCKFLVYPNPAANYIHIDFPNDGACFKSIPDHMQLIDLNGRLLYIDSFNPVWNVSNYPEGVYYLHFLEGQTIIGKEKILIAR